MPPLPMARSLHSHAALGVVAAVAVATAEWRRAASSSRAAASMGLRASSHTRPCNSRTSRVTRRSHTLRSRCSLCRPSACHRPPRRACRLRCRSWPLAWRRRSCFRWAVVAAAAADMSVFMANTHTHKRRRAQCARVHNTHTHAGGMWWDHAHTHKRMHR